MPSPVKAEIAKIIALSVLLVVLLGVGYLLRVDCGESVRGEGGLVVYDDASTVDSVKVALEGHAAPLFYGYDVVTGQRDSINRSVDGVIVLVGGRACIQRQMRTLRRVQSLHEAIGEKVPLQVLMMNDGDAEVIRAQALLFRKALRPTFKMRYTNEMNSLSRTVLSEQLEPVLIISDRTVDKVLHASERTQIVSAVSDLGADSP